MHDCHYRPDWARTPVVMDRGKAKIKGERQGSAFKDNAVVPAHHLQSSVSGAAVWCSNGIGDYMKPWQAGR